MSNKDFNKLWEVEQRLRRLFPTEMWDNNETLINLRMFGGFEEFNTRPYHNYETWSCGWEITTGKRYGEFKVFSEDLDDGIKIIEEKVINYKKSLNETKKS